MVEEKSDTANAPSIRVMAGNTLWNLFGMGLPILVGVVVFPILTRGLAVGPVRIQPLDNARFGALGLVWMLIGWFSIFDMGLGRALTKFIAEKIALGKSREIPGIFWTAVALMFLLGSVGGAIILILSPHLAGSWLKVQDALRPEIRFAFYLVAAGLPVIVMNVGLVGVLEACGWFKWINIVRLPAGCFTFIAPVIVLPFTHNLVVIVAALVAGRIIGTASYFAGCLAALPSLRKKFKWNSRIVRPLMTFGSWMVVSNLAVSFLTHLNRWLIGFIKSVEIGVYYLVPEEVVVRLFIFPRAWISVLFPAMVGSFSRSRNETTMHLERGMKYLIFGMFPIVLGICVIAPEALDLWLGSDYGNASTPVIRWLCAGVLIHSVARVPWFLLQAAGKPRIPAILHVAELIGYLLGGTLLIRYFGVTGAAIAWTFRSAVDLILMLGAVMPFVEDGKRTAEKAVFCLLVSGAVIALCVLPPGLAGRLVAGAGGFAVFMVWGWLYMFSASDRSEWISVLRGFTGKLK